MVNNILGDILWSLAALVDKSIRKKALLTQLQENFSQNHCPTYLRKDVDFLPPGGRRVIDHAILTDTIELEHFSPRRLSVRSLPLRQDFCWYRRSHKYGRNGVPTRHWTGRTRQPPYRPSLARVRKIINNRTFA